MERDIKRALVVIEEPKGDNAAKTESLSTTVQPSTSNQVIIENPGVPMLYLTQDNTGEMMSPSASAKQSSSADKVCRTMQK